MAKNDRDVIEQALRLIDVGPLAGSADGAEFAECKRHYDALLVELDDINQVGLGLVSNNIPDWAFMPLAEATAGRAAVTFGFQDKERLELKGMRKLRAYAANEARTNQPVIADYF